MSHEIAKEETVAQVFAAGILAVADCKGTSIEEIQESFPDDFWPDVCQMLNSSQYKTSEGHDWTIENASSFWQRSKEVLVGMCRKLRAHEPISPASARILELWDDGIPVIAIQAIVTQEGLTDEAGGHFTMTSIAETIDAHEKRQLPSSNAQEAPGSALMSGPRALDTDRTEITEHASTGFAIGQEVGETEVPWGEGANPFMFDLANVHSGLRPRDPAAVEKALATEQVVTKKQLQEALAETRAAFASELKSVADTLRNELREMLAEKKPVQGRSDGLRELPPVAPLQGLKKLGSRVKIAGTIDAVLMRLIDSERKAHNVSLSAMIDTMAWHYFGKPNLSFELSQHDAGLDSTRHGDPAT